ncbi:MAG: polyphenol oxidase family protein [Eubacteriales bacterium]|nr:polyphenol oxidase family protein [Eubacteriales bacterium]MDY3333118.1 polyphenol oxidase family protein [Gallibacter sp.]
MTGKNRYSWVEKDGMKFLTFNHLAEAGLFTLFTTSTMNFKDDKSLCENKTPNKEYLKFMVKEFELKADEFFVGKQEHTNHIEVVSDLNAGKTGEFARTFADTDGLVTDLERVCLLTRFADCTPVVLFDVKNRVQANVHSGWRGTTKHIAVEALKVMKEKYNTNPVNVLVGIGPTITNNEFEVDEDCANIFRESFDNIDEFMRSEGAKYMIDLQELIEFDLMKEGVRKESIETIKLSTRYDERFHSYRRQGKEYGLMCMLSVKLANK